MNNDHVSREAVEQIFSKMWFTVRQNQNLTDEEVKQIITKGRMELNRLLSAQPEPRWIPCSKKLPEMHDCGILKKIGIKQRSKRVYITIEGKRNDGGVERITDAEAELRDGEWYSDTLRWLKASGKKIEVTAWMPYPEPYSPEGDDKE